MLLNNIIFGNGAPNSTNASSTAAAKAILDVKRRNDLVDEAFLEQKDILLDMLEAKLKEVRDKKKKKNDGIESSTVWETDKCELLPNDVDIKLQASGIVAVGETDVQLTFGNTGNNNLNLNASGISNVGNTSLKLGIGNGTVNIPGLKDLFLGATLLRNACENRKVYESKTVTQPINDVTNENVVRMGSSNITNLTTIDKTTTEPQQNNSTQNI